MLTADMAKKEMDAGLSAVCAWCEHYYNVKDQHQTFNCGKDKCGGPSRGKVFPEYKGPLKNKLAMFCFICGDDSDAVFNINSQGFLGVCKSHVDHLKKMVAHPGSPPPVIKEHCVAISDSSRE